MARHVSLVSDIKPFRVSLWKERVLSLPLSWFSVSGSWGPLRVRIQGQIALFRAYVIRHLVGHYDPKSHLLAKEADGQLTHTPNMSCYGVAKRSKGGVAFAVYNTFNQSVIMKTIIAQEKM